MTNNNLSKGFPHDLKEMHAQMDRATNKLKLALEAQKTMILPHIQS